MKKQLLLLYTAIAASVALLLGSCVKIDYTKIESPAYLRVFNDLNIGITMDVKDAKAPFFCMVINPTFDARGKVNGGQIVGDFLDVRDSYAPPYPSHIGSSTSVNNPEYPGKENVLVGPIVNGYDLSSWAQIPSGKLRVMFLYRPKNTVPYFQLESSLIGDAMVDTTLNFNAKEVYTLHVLQEKYGVPASNKVLLREENFEKLPLSDSLNYVNFYNYSAQGFFEADNAKKPTAGGNTNLTYGIRERMDVYLSLYPNQEKDYNNYYVNQQALPGYKGKYLTSMVRNNTSSATTPYQSFPLFANKADNGITTKSWQWFDLFSPGMTPESTPYYIGESQTDGNWAAIACLFDGKQHVAAGLPFVLPNMVINIHSGKNNPQSFASVNTIEIINGAAYLTTVQRKYPAPQY